MITKTSIHEAKISPTTGVSDLDRYTQVNKAANTKRLLRLQAALHDILSELFADHVLVWTTGSDARFENKIFESDLSNPEIIACWSDIRLSSEDIRTQIQARTGLVIDNVELKDATVTWWLSYYSGDPKRFFPTRCLDSSLLRADASGRARSEMLQKLSVELRGIAWAYRDFKKRFATHAGIVSKGFIRIRGEDVRQLDLDSGTIHFDLSGTQNWVKHGPLRMVQYGLALGLIRRIVDSGSGNLDWLAELPTNIPERIAFIGDSGVSSVSRTDLSDLSHLYQYFLKIYHDMYYHSTTHAMSWTYRLEGDDLKYFKDSIECLQQFFAADWDSLGKLFQNK